MSNEGFVLVSGENRPQQTTVGIVNLCNTGWLSTVLQCLAHTEPLRGYFLSGDYNSDLNENNPLGSNGQVANAFAAILSDLWKSDKVVNPKPFLAALGKHNEQFGNWIADHQAATACLLDCLQEDTNKVTEKPYVNAPESDGLSDEVVAKKWWDNHHKRMDSEVANMFVWQSKSQVKCTTCELVTRRFESRNIFILPIPSQTNGDDVTLQDCLEMYCAPEVIPEVYCSRCKTFRASEKQTHLYRPPLILVVSLKRYEISKKGTRKNDTFVEFPLEGWDLTDSFQMKRGKEEGAPLLYDCYAVCNHVGDTKGGVYSNYALGGDGFWCSYQDQSVTENVSPQEVVSADAYVLYYRLRGGYESPEYVIGGENAQTMSCFKKATTAASFAVSSCVVQ